MKKGIVFILSLALIVCAIFTFASCNEVEGITLTFISEGEEYVKIEVGADGAVQFPTDPTKEGYTFRGWYYDEGTWQSPMTANSLLEKPLTANTNVYAYFTEPGADDGNNDDNPNPPAETVYYTVRFDSVGGSAVPLQNVEKLAFAIEPTAPTRAGYSFAGWYIGETLFTFFTPIATDMTLTAKWQAIDYTVSYELNGGTNSLSNPTGYNADMADITLFEPTKSSYDFDGWYTDASFQNEVTAIDTASAENITLYAKWTAVNYTVTYNLNGGINVQSNPVSYTVEDNDITLSNPERVGYTFDGWYENESLTSPETEIIDTARAENITLYAKWTAVDYSITYMLNGGTNNNSNPGGYDVEDSDITLAEPERVGYTFGGWYEDESFITTALTVIDTARAENITLYAKWTATEYTATFMDGNTTVGTVKFTVEDFSISEPSVPTKTGYTSRWQTYTLGASDVTVNVAYELITYTITYNNVKGENSNPTSYTVEDSDITLADLEKAGYIFGGWYSDSSFENAVTVIDTARAENITLYAKWNLITYTITYELNRGTLIGTNPVSYTVNDSDMTLLEPEKENFEFGGWYTEATFINKVTVIDTSAAVNLTLYAKWINPAELFTYTVSDNKATITGYTGTENTICIPSYIDGYTVTAIGDSAFEGDYIIENVFISKSVTSIGDYAFAGCALLSSIGFQDNSQLTSIGRGAFWRCVGLTSITIPSSVTSIGFDAFDECYKLVEVINKSSLSITAGSSDYGYVAYYAKEVHTGESKIKNYSDYLFYTYDGVNYLLGYIGSSTTLVFPESYNGENYEIYKYAFCNPDITSVTIPSGVTSIGEYAFHICGKLVEVINKSSLSITVGSSSNGYIARYAKEVHTGESKIKNYNDYLFYTYNGANYLLGYVGDSVSLILPESYNGQTYEICHLAFSCSNITSVFIPDGVINMGSYIFLGCKALTNVRFGENSRLTSIGYSAFSYCTGLTSIEIPSSVTSIGYEAFSGCTGLKSVSFGDNSQLTSIGSSAFSYCTGLKSVSFGDNSQLIIIDSSAFSYCTGLTSIEIPSSVTSIGSSAFEGCTSLRSVSFGDNSQLASIGSNAFAYCYKLVEVINKSSLSITAGSSGYGYVAYYAIEVHTGESKIKNYNDYLFYTYNGVNYLLGYVGDSTSLALPESYNGQTYVIYDYAFFVRSDITSITIPSNVTSIGFDAFFGCTGIKEVVNGVSYVDNWVIDCDMSVTSVNIREGTVGIASYAFYNCKGLTSIEIPSSVTNIGAGAFSGCTGLTSIEIPSSVTSIGSSAFRYCYKLVEVINKSSLSITAGSSDYGYVAYYAKEVHTGESKIKNYSDYLFYTYDGVNYLLGYVGSSTTLTLPESYNGENYVIHDDAFYKRSDITSVTIPSGVTSIGFGAFDGCTSLTSVTFVNTYGWWCSNITPATSGTDISSDDLSNSSTAAMYLRDVYYYHRWYCS